MKLFVADAGAFGTAIAAVLARAGRNVTLLIQNIDYMHLELFLHLSRSGKNRLGRRENNLYLPGAELPENLKFSDNFLEAKDADIIFLSVPSKYLLKSYDVVKRHFLANRKATLVLCSKGFLEQELSTCGAYILEDLKKYQKNPSFAVISGYTPAKPLAADLWKTFALSVASENLNAIKKVRRAFLGTNIGTLGTTDVRGVALGGALKNAYAIGYGLVIGLAHDRLAFEYLDKAHKEMRAFSEIFSANPKTLQSPPIKADFYLTCVGELAWESRNVAFGKFLAKYPSKSSIDEYISKFTVEGLAALKKLWTAADAGGNPISAPILYTIHAICEYGASPRIILDHFGPA